MSHISTVDVEVRDFDAIKAACLRLELKEPVHGKATLYQTEIEGVVVELPKWNFPIVCDLATGIVNYDNYEGRWGDRKYLDCFVQAYATEKATLEARRKGYGVSERRLEDGSIQLTVNVGGAA
jgi:hypothetical protein